MEIPEQYGFVEELTNSSSSNRQLECWKATSASLSQNTAASVTDSNDMDYP